jgi:hypothetical protein
MKLSTFTRALLVATFLGASAHADAPLLKWHGFVYPFYSVASSGVESFSNPNEGAVTAAANPVVQSTYLGAARSSFQVAQSRLGVTVTPSAELSAMLEMDFIDFTKASPTTQANPRLRRALLTYVPSANFKLVFGQDWDITSPLMPFTGNLVGHFFEAGDISFMRHQLQAIWTHGNWESAVAVGLPQGNASFAEGNTELSIVPTLALRETYKLENFEVGISALVASLRVSTTDRITSGAFTGFALLKSGSFELRSEAYVGRNTQNLGMLGLSFCNSTNFTSCPQEAGAYISAKKKMGDTSLYVSVGGAAVISDVSSILPSYNPAILLLSGTGPGIESNWTAHVGGDYRIVEGATLWGEVSYWNTRHHLATGATVDPNVSALLFQIGSQVNL